MPHINIPIPADTLACLFIAAGTVEIDHDSPPICAVMRSFAGVEFCLEGSEGLRPGW
jgi:hypothetical protein